MAKVLVLGASGATGRLLVKLLLQKGVAVVAIVRDQNTFKEVVCLQPGLTIVEAEISTMPVPELTGHLEEAEAVLSCLGHSLSFKGLFGRPRRLVTDAMRNVVSAIEFAETKTPFKVVLMNTTGNSNRDIPEVPPLSQRLVVSLLRVLLPPHADNEQAADVLRMEVGHNNRRIEWVAVRPDGLTNEEAVSSYEIHASPIRNAIFDAGQVSRINVADFMSELIVSPTLWNEWKGRMPVIYNQG